MNVAAAINARLIHKRKKQRAIWERNDLVPLQKQFYSSVRLSLSNEGLHNFFMTSLWFLYLIDRWALNPRFTNVPNINFELDSMVIYQYTPLEIEVARAATSTEGIAVCWICNKWNRFEWLL